MSNEVCVSLGKQWKSIVAGYNSPCSDASTYLTNLFSEAKAKCPATFNYVVDQMISNGICTKMVVSATAATQPASTQPASTQPLATPPASTQPLATPPASTQPLATQTLATFTEEESKRIKQCELYFQCVQAEIESREFTQYFFDNLWDKASYNTSDNNVNSVYQSFLDYSDCVATTVECRDLCLETLYLNSSVI